MTQPEFGIVIVVAIAVAVDFGHDVYVSQLGQHFCCLFNRQYYELAFPLIE